MVGFCGDLITSDGPFILSPQHTSSPDTCLYLLSSVVLPEVASLFSLFFFLFCLCLPACETQVASYQTRLQDLLHLKSRRARGTFLRDYLTWQAL